jgi:hypothetical protein
MRHILATLLFAFPAQADTSYTWAGGYSAITLQPTEAPGAVAEVVFINRAVHSDADLSFALDMGDLAVTVDALVGRGLTPDRMTVIPPDGYYAEPPEMDVEEDGVGTIIVYPYLGF